MITYYIALGYICINTPLDQVAIKSLSVPDPFLFFFLEIYTPYIHSELDILFNISLYVVLCILYTK